MAVAPTGAIYKALEFDGVSSRAYGVYITGAAVYNAPERDVEMIAIPGRNGSFALDKGRFENIEVTYPAGIFADAESDFAEAVSDFRNFLCSRNGYVRLQDEYNPNEYRMAVYKSGLEVEPALLRAGEFEIVFECKPQRYLTSGEIAVAVTSGDTLTNPTLFEARPLLEVEGYGNIIVNEGTISIEQTEEYGEIEICSSSDINQTLDTRLLNNGDSIYMKETPFYQVGIQVRDLNYYSLTNTYINGASNCDTDKSGGSFAVTFTIYPTITGFVYGTSSTLTASANIHFSVYRSGGSTVSYSATMTAVITYDGSDSVNMNVSNTVAASNIKISTARSMKKWYGDSTKYISGAPIYIDLDIGEAWNEDNGVVASINNIVSLPANLPTLLVGNTDITYDNTITVFNVVPRWWKI